MGAGGFVSGDVKNYPGKVTRHVVNACVLGAMGGFIFGYDLGISGGVTSMAPFLNRFFPDVYHKEALDTSTSQYCKFNDMGLTLFTSSLYLAALIASFGASYITRTWGRKRAMLLGGIIFFTGAALNAGAVDLSMLTAGRILLGVGVGFSNQSVPLYVSEKAPQKHRGAFNIVFQLAITIGIFIANLVNYLTPKIAGNQAWRYSLGGATIPAALICLSALELDDTPNSLLEQGKDEKAREILRKIRGLNDKEIESEFQDFVMASEAAKQVEHPWTRILKETVSAAELNYWDECGHVLCSCPPPEYWFNLKGMLPSYPRLSPALLTFLPPVFQSMAVISLEEDLCFFQVESCNVCISGN
ncbi:sugar transport protein 1-like [Populus alba x Populus x berolinensis]|nr:sugar transport protein 1-like [Populus alba x Populus x berolinensis]